VAAAQSCAGAGPNRRALGIIVGRAERRASEPETPLGALLSTATAPGPKASEPRLELDAERYHTLSGVAQRAGQNGMAAVQAVRRKLMKMPRDLKLDEERVAAEEERRRTRAREAQAEVREHMARLAAGQRRAQPALESSKEAFNDPAPRWHQRENTDPAGAPVE